MTLELLLDSATVTPPVGAGADNVTVQVELPGAETVPGEQLRPEGTTTTLRLTVAVWVWLFSVAVTIAVWLLLMVPLVAVNVALSWPVGTVTLAGTGNAVVLLASETVMALEVGWFSAMVQVVVALLARVEGEQDRELSWAGALAVRVKLCAPPFRLAVRSANGFVLAVTVAVKEPLV